MQKIYVSKKVAYFSIARDVFPVSPRFRRPWLETLVLHFEFNWMVPICGYCDVQGKFSYSLLLLALAMTHQSDKQMY